MLVKVLDWIVGIVMMFGFFMMFWVAFFFDNLDGLIK